MQQVSSVFAFLTITLLFTAAQVPPTHSLKQVPSLRAVGTTTTTTVVVFRFVCPPSLNVSHPRDTSSNTICFEITIAKEEEECSLAMRAIRCAAGGAFTQKQSGLADLSRSLFALCVYIFWLIIVKEDRCLFRLAAAACFWTPLRLVIHHLYASYSQKSKQTSWFCTIFWSNMSTAAKTQAYYLVTLLYSIINPKMYCACLYDRYDNNNNYQLRNRLHANL